MSILMPTMSYDPFNSHPYASALFDPQDHYLQPAAFSPTASYAPTTHPFPVDPRWFNNTSLSGHPSGAVTAPLQFSHIEHSDISHPQSQTDQLSLSPSSTLAPIPPLSNRSRSMSTRPRSFTNSSSLSSTRQQRRQTGPARGASTTNNNAATANPPTTPSLPVSPSLGAIQAVAATIAAQSPTSYMSSPSLPHSSSQDELESRAPKRRRLTNDTASHLHVFQSTTGLTEPPQSILSPTHHQQQQQQQHHHQLPPLHVIHVSGHHHHHLHHQDFTTGQTWAGPPTSDHLPHGVNPDQHGYQWPVGLSYYSPEAVSEHHQMSLSGSEISQPQLLPYPSPPVVGTAYFSPASPGLDTPNSALSTSHFPIRKLEPDSPILLAEAPDTEAFEHSPTEFPPRPYPGGPDAKSPWTPVKQVGKIYGSRLEQMPAIEARLAKLEDQLDHYLDVRAAQSVKNSQLPGLSFDKPSIQIKPMGPTRVFGGRIWPTALARRVRRTPRD